MGSPEKHARLAPSSSSRWILCPYSLRAPSLPPGKAATDGTADHAMAANVLLGKLDLDDVPPTRVNYKGDTIQLRAGIELYVNHVWNNQVVPAVERFWESIELDNHGGTIDTLLIADRACALYDFKTGTWPVPATGNSQLLCYAGLVAEHFDVDTFYGIIVQPNAFKGEKVKQAEFSLAEVESHREKVQWAAGNPDHKQTGDHCLWCPLLKLGQCREGKRHASKHGWKKYKHLKGVL